MNSNFARQGVAALATTLLVGGVVIEIVLAGLLAGTYLSSENIGIRHSVQARMAAESAFQDALLKIIRYKNIPENNATSYVWNLSILFQVGGADATAVICPEKDSLGGAVVAQIRPDLDCIPSVGATISTNGGSYIIRAQGSSFTRHYELNSIVSVDPITGEIAVLSVNEVPYVAN